LKDRKSRRLSADDVKHCSRIVAELAETRRRMTEVDEIIELHGCWPDAFQTEKGKASLPLDLT